MPRYYFHVQRGQVTVLDHEGVELADYDRAAEEAVRRAWQVQAGEILRHLLPRDGRIIVDDDSDTVLFELPFHADVLPTSPNGFKHKPRDGATSPRSDAHFDTPAKTRGPR
jgi:hypothetical protein